MPVRREAFFAGGRTGSWQVERMSAVTGPALPAVDRVMVGEDRTLAISSGSAWLLWGITSYERYVRRSERSVLVERQPALGRPEARCAALIPIRKAAAWWELTHDERRTIFEERSHHISTGLDYLPAIARRLYHSHDLGEPFDFLTWFEYAPASAGRFQELVDRLRKTEEWTYVEREIDIRLTRSP